MMAGSNDLLWDYTEAAPSSSPDNGLYFNNKFSDGPGVKNGLRGIKLNDGGYCYFAKAAVAGKLKLGFGPRSGSNAANIDVYTWEGDLANVPAKAEMTLVATTEELTEYGFVKVALNENQNNIYLCRHNNTETGLQYIQFREGSDEGPEECQVIFKDQNGKELFRVETFVDQPLDTLPSIDQLPAIAEDMRLRGWFYANEKKAQLGDAIQGNTTIQAKVTAVEVPAAGKTYTYDLSSPVFYPEDHELIDVQEDKIVLTLGGLKTIIVQQYNGQDLFSQDEGSEFVEVAKAGLQNVSLYFVKEFMTVDPSGYKIIPAGDVASLLLTLRTLEEGDKVFLPNGIYDLGETCLTTIGKNHVSLVGQSMEGVIIKNSPDAAKESIDKTATIKINKNVNGTYLQDLTIQNALDYYKNDNGRAVALWDCGTKTVCKNVKLLSYQDTYYSNLQGAVRYFEDCEIHGTVDFICGDGSVYFKHNLLYCEKRKASGGGSDALTANNSPASDRGYVFEQCTVKSECPVVSMGRAWNNKPSVAFLNTTVDYSAGEFAFTDGNKIQRWTKELMNANAWPQFGEYNTHLADGSVLTPSSNVVTFIDPKSSNATKDIETVLTAEEAAKFTMEYTLGEWAATAKEEAKQAVCDLENIDPEGVYLVEAPDGSAILYVGAALMNEVIAEDATVRKANARGGFGWRNGEEEGITRPFEVGNHSVSKIFRDGQVVIIREGKAYNVVGAAL